MYANAKPLRRTLEAYIILYIDLISIKKIRLKNKSGLCGFHFMRLEENNYTENEIAGSIPSSVSVQSQGISP